MKNRILKAATHDGGSFAEMASTYSRLARNEVALATVAYVAVCDRNKTFDDQLHIDEGNVAGWGELAAAVHGAGGKLCAQLHHPGLFIMSQSGTPMGPSHFWLPTCFKLPRKLSLDAITELKRKYAAAARLCAAAGFDAIELHCGHGYLLSQFLTPLLNRRSDKYGGSVEARALFPTEVLLTIKEAAPGLPVLIKMNLEDGISQAGFPKGLGLEDALVTARIFARAGADAIIPSFGYTALNGFGMLRGSVPVKEMAANLPPGASWLFNQFGHRLVPKLEYEPMFLREPARRMLAAVKEVDGADCKVIYVGGADSLTSIEALLKDGFDGVQMARPLLREPFSVRRLARAVKARERAPATAGDEGGTGVLAAVDLAVESKCIRCNHCTLASLNPAIKPGCVFLKPSEVDIEEVHARM